MINSNVKRVLPVKLDNASFLPILRFPPVVFHEVFLTHFISILYLLDLAGGHDGSLRIWELGHDHEIATYRESGKYQRVTKVHFSPHGGKVTQYARNCFTHGEITTNFSKRFNIKNSHYFVTLINAS
jgi:WD40 repeat protein